MDAAAASASCATMGSLAICCSTLTTWRTGNGSQHQSARLVRGHRRVVPLCLRAPPPLRHHVPRGTRKAVIRITHNHTVPCFPTTRCTRAGLGRGAEEAECAVECAMKRTNTIQGTRSRHRGTAPRNYHSWALDAWSASRARPVKYRLSPRRRRHQAWSCYRCVAAAWCSIFTLSQGLHFRGEAWIVSRSVTD